MKSRPTPFGVRDSIAAFAIATLVCSSLPAAEPRYPFTSGYPTRESTQRAFDDADYQRAITAYRFWYPAVSVEGIFQGNRAAGMQDNQSIGISAAGPRQVGFTLNSDTPYGSGCLDLSDGP